jgi:hypothetical protein
MHFWRDDFFSIETLNIQVTEYTIFFPMVKPKLTKQKAILLCVAEPEPESQKAASF